MKPNRNKVECDHIKLQKALEKRNLTMAEASRQIGYNEGFLSATRQKKYLNRTSAILLETLYNLKPEEYAFDKQEEVKEANKQRNAMLVDIDENELYKIIYTAMYHALRRFEKEKTKNE